MATHSPRPNTKPSPTTTLSTILIALAMVTFPIAGAVSTLVTDDPTWVQTQRIAPDVEPDTLGDGHTFGAALATTNDKLLVAAQNTETVYAYEKTDGLGWEKTQTLTHDAFPTQFGWDIAIHDDTAVIGAPAIQTAYVYHQTDGIWEQTTTLTTPNEGNDAFASSVDIHDDTIIIGAHGTPINGEHAAGAIHVYALLNDGIEHETITRENPQAGDRLGADVAIHQDTIAAITRNDAAHIFEHNDGEWEQTADTLTQTGKARTVELAGDTLAVGSPTERYSMAKLPIGDHAKLRYGSISVYERTEQGWNHIDRLEPHDGAPGEDRAYLGASMSLDATGTLLAAGAPYDDATPATTTPLPSDRDPICWETRDAIPPCHPPGAAYLFERTEDGWEQRTKLIPIDEAPGDPRLDSWNAFFGQAIALSPNAEHIAIGAPRADDLPTDDAGAAYLFQPLSKVTP